MGRPRVKQGVLAVDPFDVSSRPTPAQIMWAEWFRDIVQDISTDTYHIRRIHYRTLGKLKPDGKPYENTKNDSGLLSRASEYARYRGLVDLDKIEDHKNEGALVQVIYEPDQVSTTFSVRSKSFTHPKINDTEGVVYIDSSRCIEYGVAIRHPYHLEIWIEKSTMNDVLLPIAEKFGAALMVASGHFSLTNVKDLFNRIRNLNKPVRIFYVRDFDPAGETMAKAVARKIEWFIRTRRPEIDLKLFDIALTHEQCLTYQLPRSPMDRTDQYKGNFEEKYGKGATELDALEALHPGELANIVEEALSPYFDEELEETINDLEDSELEALEQCQEDVIDKIVETKRPELEPLISQYNKLVVKVNKVGVQIEELIHPSLGDYQFEPEYPGVSSLMVDDEKTPVLDTSISYEEQLEKYRGGGRGDERN